MLKDCIGLTFGYLTVKARMKNNNRSAAMWLCNCKCGRMIVVSGYSLRSHNTTSCGCRKIKDLRGKIYGRLLVVSQNPSRHKGSVLWNCRCECGKDTVVESKRLLWNITKSCGCLSTHPK